MHGLKSDNSDNSADADPALLSTLLASLSIKKEDTCAGAAKGDYLKIVDFISADLQTEDEVSLGGGISIKMAAKPKLDKVSPSAWITANARIMRALLDKDPNIAEDYLVYTEMIGELGCHFTWQSVLIFDNEYRKRQHCDGSR